MKIPLESCKHKPTGMELKPTEFYTCFTCAGQPNPPVHINEDYTVGTAEDALRSQAKRGDMDKLEYAIELLDHLYIKDDHTQAALEYVLKILKEEK